MPLLRPQKTYCCVVMNPAREHLAQDDAPWWESAENMPPVPVDDAKVQSDPQTVVDLTDPTAFEQNASITQLPVTTDESPAIGRPEARTETSPTGLTLRGAFLVMLMSSSVACVIGFFSSGTTSIPAQTGWGLVIGTLVAALLVPARLSLTVVWLPPLVAATTVVLLGQITLLGSSLTFARELAMVAAGLTSLAPAQLLSVGVAALVLVYRRLRAR